MPANSTTEEMGPRSDFNATGVSRKYPTGRDQPLSVDKWLVGKQADDGAETLWRIHDDLYDLSSWMDKHPGGAQWLELTKGTDATELFECHHLSERPQNMLSKFHVRKAKTPRNSLITFHEDGFYRTLKRRVQKVIKETGPTWGTTLLTDALLTACLTCGVLGALYSWWWAALSGLFLHMIIVCSHNFFHMKDNFRMYYFNLSLMSYRDWRISHIMSHHIFPNSVLDLEVSMWEPIFKYLPDSSKTVMDRFFPWFYSPIAFIIMFHRQFILRFVDVLLKGGKSFRGEELIFLLFPLFITLVSGTGFLHSFYTWNVVILTASAIFGVVGLTAAHHHPEIYHEGDYLGENKDFAVVQLAAVRDRIEVFGNFFLVMITFGDHALHHMFPIIDHGRLPALYPCFEQTCKEFGIEFKLMHVTDLFTGMYKQLARNYQNARLMIEKGKKKK